MKPTEPRSTSLLSQLLILPDGSVLAENLTPAMAAALEQIPLRPDSRTQRSLVRNPGDKTVVDQGREHETEGTP